MATPSSDEDELGAYNANDSPFRTVNYDNANSKQKLPNGRGMPMRAEQSRTLFGRMGPAEEALADDQSEEEMGAAFATERPKKVRQVKRAITREQGASQSSRKTKASKAKGKEKETRETGLETSAEVMDVDNDDETDHIHETLPPDLNLRKQNQHGPVPIKRKIDERARKRMERLENQLNETKKQRDNLAEQLEELFHARNTELEERIETLTSAYESRIQTQEESLKEMTSQLARVDSLTREGKTTTLHILTREAADEERRELDRELERLRAALKEKDRIISERDTTIKDRDQEIRTISSELAAEIERSKTLVAARPNAREPQQSKVRPLAGSTTGKVDNVKSTNILRLYEDMSNILFIDCKCEISAESEEEQWVYNCLYKHVNSKQSLSFILRTYVDDEDGGNIEKVAYTPLHVENDSEELLERLDFLQEEFTFTRQQLDIFMHKLHTAMTETDE